MTPDFKGETAGVDLPPRGLRGALYALGNLLGFVWIAGGMMFFFLRFSFILYRTHQTALDPVISQWLR